MKPPYRTRVGNTSETKAPMTALYAEKINRPTETASTIAAELSVSSSAKNAKVHTIVASDATM